MKIEFNIRVKDDGWFVRFLRRFGKQINRYWWALPLGFKVWENYTGTSTEINMLKTVARWKQ